MHAVEGAADLDIAGLEGEPDGQQTDHRNDGQQHNSVADRHFGEEFSADHESTERDYGFRGTNDAAFHASKAENG